MVSFTPLIVGGKLKGISRDLALDLCKEYPDQICVGTTVTATSLSTRGSDDRRSGVTVDEDQMIIWMIGDQGRSGVTVDEDQICAGATA